MSSEKEQNFEKEYKQLLKKHNVSLYNRMWSDEFGDHSDLSFKENGKYCNINYSPPVLKTNSGRCGMGS